jgi:DDE family transposase
VVVFGCDGKGPRSAYRYYGQRGGCENRIKELKGGVKADRTSCHAFLANQFRLLLAAVAYVLLIIRFLSARQDSVYAAFANCAIEVCRAVRIAVLTWRPREVTW